MARPADPNPAPAPAPAPITVIVTVLKDPRVARTIESLLEQELPPAEILVDDGGVTDEVRRLTEGFAARDPRVVYLYAPGNIPESRNLALARARGSLIAFLDADEVAPPGWLRALTSPFSDPRVGFTGGPTPALPGTARTVGARYYDAYLRRFYETVARHHPHALPMGNSAWRREVFDDVGTLDATLDRRAASEDQDVALRALERGWTARYVPEAWVGHDFSDLTVPSLLRKQRIYAQGGYVVWRRRRSTYEASVGRVLPYVLLPAAVVVGAAVALVPGLAPIGLAVLGVGAVGLGLLALGLTVQGLAGDRTYPGFRFRAVEILRRWATLYGAFRGLLAYGVRGRAPPTEAPPSAGAGKL